MPSKILALIVAQFLSLPLMNAQWSEPIRITTLSTHADEFAPSWSSADSTLYFARYDGTRLYILAWHHCDVSSLLHANPPKLDTLRDSIVYASFAHSRWVGQRYVRGLRQYYTQLVSSAQSRRDHAAIPIAEISRTDEFTMFPALSPDGRRLVFAATDGDSDMETDLWMSQWMGSHWSAPYRLDGFEQSSASEITPCFAGSDTLFFASNGYGGKGGFDIFITIEQAGLWSAPIPVEELNSPSDDRDVCVLPNGDLLFASARAGTLDLYYARCKTNERSR